MKKIKFQWFLIIGAVLFITTSTAMAQKAPTKEYLLDGMYKIDKGRHSTVQFESVVNVLQKYFPEGDGVDSNGDAYFDICFYLTEMHAKAQAVTPDLGLYEFVLGFKNFVRDSGGDGTFVQVLAVYTTAKMNGF